MINSASFDLQTLAAVKPGLNAAFAEISARMERFLKSPAGNESTLEAARAQLRGLLGVLKMAGL